MIVSGLKLQVRLQRYFYLLIPSVNSGYLLLNILGGAVVLPLNLVRVMSLGRPVEVLPLFSRTQNITLADEILLWIIIFGFGWVLGMLSYEHFIPCTQACVLPLKPLGVV